MTEPESSALSRDTEDLPLQTSFSEADCPELTLNIDMRRTDEYESDQGVLIKVLQHPQFTDENRAPPGDLPSVPPQDWDRSEFPENACVVRLRGVRAECYTNENSMAIYHPPTDAGTPVGQASYNARRFLEHVDLCDWEPGCPRSDWGNFTGYWWYLSQRENDSLLVACPSSCEGFFRKPTDLELHTLQGPGICDLPADAGAGASSAK